VLDFFMGLTYSINYWSIEPERADRVREHPASPDADHGVSMARRCSQRMRTHACAQEKVESDQQADYRAVSLAFERVRRTNKAQGALAWLSGFRAGFYGAPYVWPLRALDPQVWALGFIEGRGHGGRV
jgi:hypothetical protein